MNGRKVYMGLVAVVLILAWKLQAQEIPQIIHYQGNLAFTNGNAVTENLQMIFRIYVEKTGGTPIWTEIHDGVQIVDGLFSVQLGSIDPSNFPITSELFSGERYLAISIAGGSLTPRQKIGSLAYALVSQTVPDGAIEGRHIVNNTIGIAKLDFSPLTSETDPKVGSITTNRVPRWDGSALVNGTIRDINGNVGIGTSSPQAKLDVNGDVDIRGRLLPDYDSGWVADNNGTVHKTRFRHNLGVIPMRLEIWFSPNQIPTTVYPVGFSWHDRAMGPVSISGTTDSIYLHIFVTPLWQVFEPAGGWTGYDNGFWRVLVWK